METQPLAVWCQEAHRLAVGKGFWGDNPSVTTEDPTHIAAKIAFLHSEVSELLEAQRGDPKAPCDKLISLTREEEEVADIFLRLADYCGARDINLGRAATLKYEYNKTRPQMHGKRL